MRTRYQWMIVAGAPAPGCSVMAAEMDKKDADYLRKTAQGTMSEVSMGEMAEKQAADPRVEQFGKRMVDDHGKDLRNLRERKEIDALHTQLGK